MSEPQTFKSVTLEAVHVPETHTTRETSGAVTEVELPGEVYLYVNIDGGRVLLDRLHAGKVFEAQEAARSQSSSSEPLT